MPDVWEKENGLDPADAADRNILADGYTLLARYLNSIN
jgi:pectate lyase